MSLSTTTRLATELVRAADAFGPVTLAEFEVPLPRRLALGQSVLASVHGAIGAPVVVVLGGISANRFPHVRPDRTRGWWPGLVGPQGAIDPGEFQILGLDFAADESGESAPSTQDQAAVICAALDRVGVQRAHAIIGASYGGMTALSLGAHFPDRAERLVVISAGFEPHPTATAFRELQRRIVALGLAAGTADEALSIARGLAMCTYRTPAEFESRFAGGIDGHRVAARSEPGDYLRARGDNFLSVMSPQRFLSLSASIDRHRVDPKRIKLPTLVIGATSDQLVPPSQLKALAEQLPGPVSLHLLKSLFGHDMFLKNVDQLAGIVAPFLRSAC